MKNTILLTLLTVFTFLAFSCRKDQYFVPDISGAGTDTITLSIGDKMVLAPNISNTRDNSYTWLLNGEKVATGQVNYTFQATSAGNFEVLFRASNGAGTTEQSFKIKVEKQIVLAISAQQPIPMCQVLEIKPTVTGPDRTDYKYEWSIADSVIGTKSNLSFISPQAGTFALTFKVTAGKQTTTATSTITVTAANYVRNAFTVLEYAPAPATNHDWSVIGYYDNWKYGDEYPLPYADFLTKASAIRKEDSYAALILGSWGGSATFQFDHTVANAPGKPDLELSGIFSNRDLPAVYVAYDRNKNGKPDPDEWYEIKNGDYGQEDIKDYAITFTYDSTKTDAKRIYSYLSWKDNQSQPASGQIMTNKTFTSATTTDGNISTRGFFPGLNVIDINTKQVALLDGWNSSFTRSGKRIKRDLTGAATYSQKINIDIDMAVNDKGETVWLPGIDFIKVRKVVYPIQQDQGAGGPWTDYNMDEKRMLHVGSILDKNLTN